MRSSDKIALAIAGAGAVIAFAVYNQPRPARYQGFAVGSEVARLDTETGAIIACDEADCMVILNPSREVLRNPNHKTMLEEAFERKNR